MRMRYCLLAWLTHVCVSFQAQINQGNQLVHSPFLQSLCALAVGLDIDKVLSDVSETKSTLLSLNHETSLVPEWSWLHCFSTAMRTSDALTFRKPFPEEFSVPDEEAIDSEIAYQPMVGVYITCIVY